MSYSTARDGSRVRLVHWSTHTDAEAAETVLRSSVDKDRGRREGTIITRHVESYDSPRFTVGPIHIVLVWRAE